MAKQQQQPMRPEAAEAPPSPLRELRAWELFARSVQVSGTPTHTHDHLAAECFKAAAAFEAVAEQQTETKG